MSPSSTRKIETVRPAALAISDYNERQSESSAKPNPDDEAKDDLRDSVDDIGFVHTPVVRPIEDADPDDTVQYEVIVGQRRVGAAQSMPNIEEVFVEIRDVEDNLTALKMSITENIESFNNEVESIVRQNALIRMWDLMGGEGPMSAPRLAEELNVAENTVRDWLEPFREEWAGTDVDPRVPHDGDQNASRPDVADEDPAEVADEAGAERDDRDPDGPDMGIERDTGDEGLTSENAMDDEADPTDSDTSSNSPDSDGVSSLQVRNLGDKKKQLVRRMVGGGEEGEQMLYFVAEHDLSVDDLKEVKKADEDGGMEPMEAIKRIAAGDPLVTDTTDEAEVSGGDGDGAASADEGETTKTDGSEDANAGKEGAESGDGDDTTEDGSADVDPIAVDFTLKGKNAQRLRDLATDRKASPDFVAKELLAEALDNRQAEPAAVGDD